MTSSGGLEEEMAAGEHNSAKPGEKGRENDTHRCGGDL